MHTETPQRALHGITVLDLGGEITNYCGRMFAQLGADVILVEPIDGSSYRGSMPTAGEGGESLRFAYDNADKKSIGVDLSTPGGRDVFSRLADTADLLLDDRTQHDLRSGGFPHEQLSTLFPNLTTTAITPFGLTGPYADFAATDATCMAFGGMLWLGGYDAGPPVQPAGRQAFRAGSLFGAVASMASLTANERSSGELIDVSVQECVSLGLENAIQFYDLEGHVRRRHGGKQKQAGFGVYPCADGYVVLIAAGIGGNRFWPNFVAWMKEEQVPGADVLDDPRWSERDFVESPQAQSLFWDVFTTYSTTRTKEHLLTAAVRWNVPLSPVKTMAEVHQSPQLRARGFFSELEVGAHRAEGPGAPYQLSETPWSTSSCAPRVGEHTTETLQRLGYTDTDITDMLHRKEIS